MPVDSLTETRQWLTTKIGGQQTQRPEEGIPEGGPIPQHRDTTTIQLKIDRLIDMYSYVSTNIPRSDRQPILWRCGEGKQLKINR